MDFEPDLEPAINAQFPRKWMEACFETCALVLGVEETVPGRTSRSHTASQALCTRVRGWKSSTCWTAPCDVWMALCLTPCGGWCVSVACQTQRK